MSDSYGFGADGKYCHPGSNVLINRLGIVDAKELEKSERQITTFKLTRVSMRRALAPKLSNTG